MHDAWFVRYDLLESVRLRLWLWLWQPKNSCVEVISCAALAVHCDLLLCETGSMDSRVSYYHVCRYCSGLSKAKYCKISRSQGVGQQAAGPFIAPKLALIAHPAIVVYSILSCRVLLLAATPGVVYVQYRFERFVSFANY